MLRHLALGCCITFPSSFYLGQSLTCLKLSKCRDIALPENVFINSPNLVSLELLLWRNLKPIPQSINSLLNLSNLVLLGCSALESLPTEISNLTKLSYLNLRWCSAFRSLPICLGKLVCLSDLDLRECSHVDKLPPSVSCLTSLKILDLSYCSGLREWPSSLTSLTSLYSLFVSGISRPALCLVSTTMPWLAPSGLTGYLRDDYYTFAGFVHGFGNFGYMPHGIYRGEKSSLGKNKILPMLTI